MVLLARVALIVGGLSYGWSSTVYCTGPVTVVCTSCRRVSHLKESGFLNVNMVHKNVSAI